MGTTNTRKLGILGGVVLLAASGASQASLITGPNLTYGNANFLGFIGDGIPSSLSMEASYINNLNSLAAGAGSTTIGSETYSRSDSTLSGPFVDAVVLGATKDESVDDVDSSSLQAGIYQYILGKYDGRNYGSLVWYNADGFTGNITLQGTAGTGNYALSHISFFNSSTGDPSTSIPVPATLLLFGLGLLGLGFLNRRR